MRVAKYWTKGSYTGQGSHGNESTFSAWGWSLDSMAAAKDNAVARAKRIFDYLVNGTRLDTYEYADVPMREEIVQTLRNGDKDIAIITRNGYGALVINTASVLFADVDYPRIRANGLWDALVLAFSRARREWRTAACRELTLDSIREWSRQNPGRSFRIYRTRAGLRLLFVDRLYEPKSAETSNLLKELGSDPLYNRLTSKQECFRARLTPKPWRCGCKSPPHTYPWKDVQAERSYRDWERRYAETTKAYGVCELVETCGVAAPSGEIAQIVDLHDRMACGGSRKELA